MTFKIEISHLWYIAEATVCIPKLCVYLVMYIMNHNCIKCDTYITKYTIQLLFNYVVAIYCNSVKCDSAPSTL